MVDKDTIYYTLESVILPMMVVYIVVLSAVFMHELGHVIAVSMMGGYVKEFTIDFVMLNGSVLFGYSYSNSLLLPVVFVSGGFTAGIYLIVLSRIIKIENNLLIFAGLSNFVYGACELWFQPNLQYAHILIGFVIIEYVLVVAAILKEIQRRFG